MRTVLKFKDKKKEDKMGYNTSAKSMISEFFASNPDMQFSTEQVSAYMAKKGGKIPGKSTVYRIIASMCESGELARSRDAAGTEYLYRYIGKKCNCDEHLHLKCTECGRIYHLECPKSIELVSHILEEHGFSVSSGSSVLYGKCVKCKKTEAK